MEYINEKLEEFNRYLFHRKVAIIGLGVSNVPLIDYFHECKSYVTVFDNRNIDEIPKEIMDKITGYAMEFALGPNSLEKLKGFDIIFRSPSCMPNIPELEEEKQRGAIVTSEVEMLMEMCPGTVIGVTGSDGKTTTTTLIYEILQKSGYNCYLGGNIGTPLFTRLPEMLPEDYIVLELSSFQLMEMKISPHIAVITNISPNHLNVHSSYEEYIEAKANIFKYQTKDDIVVLNYDNDVTRELEKQANGKVVFFSGKAKLDDGFIIDDDIIKECEDKIRRHVLKVQETNLRGKHNYENICTALAATKSLVDLDTATQVVKEFSGVEHRLEFIKELFGAKWYNDSIGSSPTRTIAGINSFDEDIILIAGGYDKNLDYEPMAKPILDKVKALILVGQTAEKIFFAVKNEEEKTGKHVDIYMCNTLEETAMVAKRIVKPGQVVLFSPASASFDMFKNFDERGKRFKQIVNEML